MTILKIQRKSAFFCVFAGMSEISLKNDDSAEAMRQNIPAEASFPGLGNGAVLQRDNVQVFTL